VSKDMSWAMMDPVMELLVVAYTEGEDKSAMEYSHTEGESISLSSVVAVVPKSKDDGIAIDGLDSDAALARKNDDE
jgi:hypothetical protein